MALLARRIAPLLLLFAASCAVHVQTPATQRAAADELVAEARAFMASYAVDLREGRRDAIIARYDPRGAYLVGRGQKELVPMDSLVVSYRQRWEPPASFAWSDLSFEPAGPDAVVVTGVFDWGVSAERTMRFSYTGLLLRRDGRWMIRLEDENPRPERRPPSP